MLLPRRRPSLTCAVQSAALSYSAPIPSVNLPPALSVAPALTEALVLRGRSPACELPRLCIGSDASSPGHELPSLHVFLPDGSPTSVGFARAVLHVLELRTSTVCVPILWCAVLWTVARAFVAGSRWFLPGWRFYIVPRRCHLPCRCSSRTFCPSSLATITTSSSMLRSSRCFAAMG
jgi:hypothetical protein